MGRNLHRVDDATADLLDLVDGVRSWRELFDEHARKHKEDYASVRRNFGPLTDDLREKGLVLERTKKPEEISLNEVRAS